MVQAGSFNSVSGEDMNADDVDGKVVKSDAKKERDL